MRGEGTRWRSRAGALLLLGVLGVMTSWAAVPEGLPGPPGFQLFSSLEQPVVARGAPLTLRVEAYAVTATPEEAARIEAAFRAGGLAPLEAGLVLVRREDRPARRISLAPGQEIVSLSARFILQAQRVGPHTVPAFRMRLGGQGYATPAQEVHVYQVEPAFFASRHAVVPVTVEVRDAPGRRLYLRNGSAFLAAPDAFVTGYHVVMDAERIELTLPNGKRIRPRRAWAVDPVHDVVVLYVNPKETAAAGMQPLPLAALDDEVGRAPVSPSARGVVFTYGWPGGVQHSTAGRRYEGVALTAAEQLWVSANPVRPGDSGGPLLNHRGEVLGVVTAGTVLGRHRDVLREEVCIASDPRPALRQRLLGARPRLIEDFFEDPRIRSLPHTLAFRLSSLLLTGRRQIRDLDVRVADFEAAVAQWQNPDPGLHFMQGVIYQLLGTNDEAAAAYHAALDVYDDYFPAAYMLARHHLAAGHYAAAERFFRRTGRYAPYAHLAAYGQAQALMKLLRYEEAVPLLQDVLRYNAGFGPALYDLAVSRMALGDRAAVQALHARLFEVSPRWARRLRRVLEVPALQPVTVAERPRATLPVLR